MIETTIKGSYNGLPYEGPPLNLKNDDPPSMQPRMVAEVFVNIYDMSVESDVIAYQRVMDGVAKGHVRISFEERQWLPRTENWKILLRTLNLKYIEPEDMSRAEESNIRV